MFSIKNLSKTLQNPLLTGAAGLILSVSARAELIYDKSSFSQCQQKALSAFIQRTCLDCGPNEPRAKLLEVRLVESELSDATPDTTQFWGQIILTYMITANVVYDGDIPVNEMLTKDITVEANLSPINAEGVDLLQMQCTVIEN